MTRYEQLTDQINANTQRLLTLPPDSAEAMDLRHATADLMTIRLNLTVGEAGTIVPDPVFTPNEMAIELAKARSE